MGRRNPRLSNISIGEYIGNGFESLTVPKAAGTLPEFHPMSILLAPPSLVYRCARQIVNLVERVQLPYGGHRGSKAIGYPNY